MIQFSDLTKAVHEAVTFAARPLTAVITAYGISWWIYPEGVAAVNGHLSLTALVQSAESLRDALTPFGLTALIPVASALALISTLYLINRLVISASGAVPPHLTYQTYYSINQTLNESQKRGLLRKYPLAVSVGDAFNFACKDVKKSGDAIYNGSPFYYDAIILIKFSFLCSLCAALLSMSWLAWFKFGGLLIAQSLLWTLMLTGLLYEKQQYNYREKNAVIDMLNKEIVTLAARQPVPNEQELIQESHMETVRWWNIEVVNTFWLRWLRDTFMPKAKPEIRSPKPE